jgi:hypothetical protein
VLPLLHRALRTPADPRRVALPASLALALLGIVWCVQRLLPAPAA